MNEVCPYFKHYPASGLNECAKEGTWNWIRVANGVLVQSLAFSPCTRPTEAQCPMGFTSLEGSQVPCFCAGPQARGEVSSSDSKEESKGIKLKEL